ncbi:hypothetical protein [Ramlibacter humi]|uniref:SPFH domain-containing protein n=1 Tax=Ramlibacter humi TaxID=2530451 RepID=A0A4Z0BEB3_9BURK|nr:hypothetical protein [Ramlibacter humi]TFY97160.1 hypothetical protein EZ216_18945 [Ramlibacter humi]
MQRRLIAALVAIAAAGAAAQDVEQHGRGAQCLSGDCQNGVGTIARQDGQFTGPWRAGRFAGGQYEVRWPGDPSRTYPVRMDAEGMMLEGTQVRGAGDFRKVTSTYTGTFTRIWNPFVERNLAAFGTGKYTDYKGITYDGEFQYVPSRAWGDNIVTGIFLFQGVRIDPVEDEVISGLFISDATVSGANIIFYRARPDYIAKLQQDFAFDKAKREQDQASQANSQAALGMLLNLTMGAAAMSGGGNRLNAFSGRGDRAALNLFGDVLRGAQPAQAAADNLAGQLLQRAVGQPQGAAALGLGLGAGASSKDVAQSIGQALLQQPRKLTLKEYTKLIEEAAKR